MSRSKHPQIKRSYCCDTRFQSWHHKFFHGFGNQFKNGTLNYLLLIWKHNSGILTQDHAPQPLIFNNRNRHITFGNKQEQVLHEFLLPQILFLIKKNTTKVISDGPITNNRSMPGFFPTLVIFYSKIQNLHSFTLPMHLHAQMSHFFH